MKAVLAMTMAFTISAALGQSAVPLTSSQPKTLVIDGSKNPELFPQWYAWETFFRAFPTESRGEQLLRDELGVSAVEFQALTAEARAFRQSEVKLSDALHNARRSLQSQGKKESDVRDATKIINLKYRQDILDARGRIVAALSSDSLPRVLAWIDQRLRGVTLYLSGRTLEYFNQPW